MWFHPQTARRLAEVLEVPASCVGAAMGDDVRMTWVNNNWAMEGVIHENQGESHVDPWGIRWVREGEFNQPAGFPLAGASRQQMLDYEFPEDRMDFLLHLMDPVLAERDRYFIGCDVSPCVFEMYWRLRGLENAILDMATDQELTHLMFDRCAAFARELSRRAATELPIDMLWSGDDVAGQSSLIMSPQAWRDLIKPLLAEIFQEGKSRGLWVAYHCCGALRPIIPDLVEIGLDLLNPIQAGCPGMDARELKREFGSCLAFMGGVDTQDLLPFGTAARVRRETESLLEAMTAGGGGYILAASHTIPPETPDENIFALYETAGIGRQEIMDRAADIRAART